MLQADIKTAPVGDAELAYFDVGQGLPVVCIHGWPQHGYCWRRLAGELVPRVRVIAPDLRGCGDSALAADGFDKKTLAADVAGLIRHLDVEGAVVVGHDWGAPIAYRMALDAPALLRALVIMNGRMPLLERHTNLMFTPQQVRERWYFNFNLVPELPETMIAASLDDFLRHILVHWSAGEEVHTEADIAEYRRVLGRPGGLTAGLGFYRTAVAQDVNDWREHAGAVIDIPNLVLWGARDPVLPPDFLDGLEAVTPDLEVHVHDGAGHFLQEQAPEWCGARLLDFLQRRAGAGARA